MALTNAQVREILSAAGVDSEHMRDAVKAIIDGHTASIEALREDVATYKAEAEKLQGVQKELNDLKADITSKYITKEAHQAVVNEYENYKADVSAKAEQAKVEKAVKAYYEGKNITGKALEIAMRGSTAEIKAAKLDAEGKLTEDSTKALDSLVTGTFSGLVSQTTIRGAQIATPPENGGAAATAGSGKTLEEKYHNALYGAPPKEG